LIHTILVLVTVGLGNAVYIKLHILIGGQRAEKFENHWFTVWVCYVTLALTALARATHACIPDYPRCFRSTWCSCRPV